MQFDAAAPFPFFDHADLYADAFVQFLAVGDDADAPPVLSGDFLQAFEGGHDGVETFLVECAESFIDEQDVDVHAGAVERGEGQ